MRLRRSLVTLFTLCALTTLSGPLFGAPLNAPLPDGLYAEIITPRGTITTELFFEKTPLTVASFVGLAEGTLGPKTGDETRKPYFDGLKFHRVVPDFVVQGGDPLGTGEGGPGYEFPDELVPGLRHDAAGVLSMANHGPDTNGSQFFFTLRETNRLNYLHSVFGRVVRGLEVLPAIVQGDTMQVKIIRAGAAAQAFRADEASFAALVAKTPKAAQPYFDDPDGLLPTEPPRAKAFNYKLANVARFTGLKIYATLFAKLDPADAEAKPGALAKRYAERCGVVDDGVSVLYFADRDLWAIWVGDKLLPKFNPTGVSLHDAKQAFFASAKARAAEVVAYAEKAAPPDKPLSPQQKLKLTTDTVLDGLISLLEPSGSDR